MQWFLQIYKHQRHEKQFEENNMSTENIMYIRFM